MFRDSKAAFWFILPALVFLCVFKRWPIAVSLGESLMQTSISGRKLFVGLENYAYLLYDDPVFWGSVRVTLLYSLVINPLAVAVSLALALLLDRRKWYVGFFRALCFLPSAISLSVVAVI